MFSFGGKRVLVAGGTGLIGLPLVEFLVSESAEVTIASLDTPRRVHDQARFVQIDLTSLENCGKVVRGMDYVFNLLGIKASPEIVRSRPATLFVPHLLFNTSLMEAARQAGVTGFLYTSTFGVYGPADVFYEDDMWKSFPSKNDWFAGWAKRMGELQAEAYKQDEKERWENISIIRPASTYGPHDNFWSKGAMVVPALIKRVVDGENPLRVWGDGSQVRDFIHASDVARGMILVAKKSFTQPVNLGSGKGVSIRTLVDLIIKTAEVKVEVVWDTSRPTGDQKRILDIARARSLGFEPAISLEEGIYETIEWYRRNKDNNGIAQYTPFL